MPKRTSVTGSELFIVDNSNEDWKVLRYLHDWCQISESIDIATAYFEIGSLLALQDEWQKVDQIRILMGDEVSRRTIKTDTASVAWLCPDTVDCMTPNGKESQAQVENLQPTPSAVPQVGTLEVT